VPDEPQQLDRMIVLPRSFHLLYAMYVPEHLLNLLNETSGTSGTPGTV